MLKFILNKLKVSYGTYTTEGNKIRRTFSWGFSYIAEECKSPEEATRIVNQLNQISN